MKVDKSLEEVWKWKESIYKEVKGLPLEKQLEEIIKMSKETFKKSGLKLKTGMRNKLVRI